MFANTLIALLIFLLPVTGEALCLKDCGQPPRKAATLNPSSSSPSSVGYMADSVRYREKSHNTGDVKNSVMGDVNIHVGHKKVDIKMDSGGNNNMVNAAVSSTIILGDMKQ